MLTRRSEPLHVLEGAGPGARHLHVEGVAPGEAACGSGLAPEATPVGGVGITLLNHERLCLKNGCRAPLLQWTSIHAPELCRLYRARVEALEAARRRPRGDDGQQGVLF